MVTSEQLTRDQKYALGTITEWYGGTPPWHQIAAPGTYVPTLTLGGYAGTGKTTLLGMLSEHLSTRRIVYVSYTGKAVSVLRRKLPPGAQASTIHRLLYKPHQRYVCKETGEEIPQYDSLGYCDTHKTVRDKLTDSGLEPPEPCTKVTELAWQENLNPLEGLDLVVVDEASMVSERIWTDLTKWGVPVLACGDHGQLPPIKSEFNLMAEPQLKLEEIVRQMADSPIIQMATMARERGRLPIRRFGPGAKKIPLAAMRKVPLDPYRGDVIICGYNKTRNDMNEAIRRQYDRTGPPAPNDIVICLRNSYEQGIFNGMRGRIKEITDEDPYSHTAYALIEMFDDGFDFYGKISMAQFGQPKTMNTISRHIALFD